MKEPSNKVAAEKSLECQQLEVEGGLPENAKLRVWGLDPKIPALIMVEG